jgi:hypothetical protein
VASEVQRKIGVELVCRRRLLGEFSKTPITLTSLLDVWRIKMVYLSGFVAVVDYTDKPDGKT